MLNPLEHNELQKAMMLRGVDYETSENIIRDFRLRCAHVLGSVRYNEIMQAEREGRLVILPCKVGDTIYGIRPLKKLDGSMVQEMKHGEVACFKVLPSGTYCVAFAEEQYYYPVAWRLDDFGKTVFLSSDEAEKALEEAK